MDPDLLAYLERMKADLLAALVDPDLVRLQKILPQIVAVVPDKFFRVTDLVEYDIDYGGLTPPQVGLLLANNTYRAIGEFRIVATKKKTSGGRQYQVLSLRSPRRG